MARAAKIQLGCPDAYPMIAATCGIDS